MRFTVAVALAASYSAAVAATGVLLPLYVYPAPTDDGATTWEPALAAMAVTEDTDWLTVINPDSGPGATGQPGNDDANYISGVAQLNCLENVELVGYVRADYAQADMEQLKANISTWARWWDYDDEDLHVHGVFIDESFDDWAYMEEATDHARAAFDDECTIVCNFGVATRAAYYDLCDVVIAFESCLNCADAPQYQDASTLRANIPHGYERQAAVIVNEFAGAAWDGAAASSGLLYSYIRALKQRRIGYAWFTSADYHTLTAAPATVARVGEFIDATRRSSSCRHGGYI